MPRTQLFVKGLKDKVMRQVQHIPQNADVKETRPLRRVGLKDEVQPNHFVMMLGDPANAARQIIAESRIIKVVTEAAGLPT